MIVRKAPTKILSPGQPLISGTDQYSVIVIDSSSTQGHGPDDTRLYPSQSGMGIGSGEFRLYANPTTGAIVGYTWSSYSSSTYYPNIASGRQIVVGRLSESGLQKGGFSVTPFDWSKSNNASVVSVHPIVYVCMLLIVLIASL
jgi:hypothetical protein